MTWTELTLWQQLLLVALAGIALVYVLYYRIWVALAAGSDLVFIAALLLASASVAAPTLFERATIRLVDETPLPAALKSADARITDLEALPGRLVARALAKVGYEEETEAASAAAIEGDPDFAEAAGPFESHVRPAVEALVSAILRTTGFFFSTMLLLMALAMRSGTSTARALRDVRARLDRLENPTAHSIAEQTGP